MSPYLRFYLYKDCICVVYLTMEENNPQKDKGSRYSSKRYKIWQLFYIFAASSLSVSSWNLFVKLRMKTSIRHRSWKERRTTRSCSGVYGLCIWFRSYNRSLERHQNRKHLFNHKNQKQPTWTSLKNNGCNEMYFLPLSRQGFHKCVRCVSQNCRVGPTKRFHFKIKR